MKINDFIQITKYRPPDKLINNLDKLAQKLAPKTVPETKLPITLSPAKNIIRPISTFICMISFCFEGTPIAIRPKIRIGTPNMAGM